MPELLLELLSEEIPARMQARAADDLKRLVTAKLTEAGLSFDKAEAYVTPRRLALVVDGLPLQQPDVTEEKKGPRVGAPDKAIQGFLRSVGLTSLDQCEKRDTGKGELHTPVSAELEAIMDSPVKGHVILIDDARCFDGTQDYPHLDRLLETARRKNTYHIEVSTDIIRLTPKN